jgi:hypothetical protein
MSQVHLEDQLLEPLLDDHVLDRRHGDLEERRVGGVSEMAVDFSCGVAIESHEFLHKVGAGLLLAGAVTRKVRESKLGGWAGRNLLLEEVDLV